MSAIVRSKPGHWASQDFVDSRFHALEAGTRAQRIGIVSAQLAEYEEHQRIYPSTAAYMDHEIDALRDELRALHRADAPAKSSVGFVCTCVVLLPLALISIFSLVGHLLSR